MDEVVSLVGHIMLIATTLLSIFSLLCMLTSNSGGNSTKEIFSTTIRVDLSRKVLRRVVIMLSVVLVAEIANCVVMSVLGG